MKSKHPIRVVARRTGLSTHLIRMWEKRYNAVTPARTGTQRRLYSDADIERLSLLRQATLAGETISQMVSLTNEELRQLLIDDNNTSPDKIPVIFPEETANRHLEKILDALRQFNIKEIETRLLNASITLGQQVFLEKILQPLMHQVGEWWSNGEIKIAQEHLTSSVIRSLLGNMIVSSQADENAPLILATTPSGQLHELGALMAAVTAVSQGWRVIYLGPNLPAEEIALAAQNQKARAVLLSLIYPSDDPRTHLELIKLSQLLQGDIKIMIGGRVATAYSNVINKLGAVACDDLSELKVQLDALRENNPAGAS